MNVRKYEKKINIIVTKVDLLGLEGKVTTQKRSEMPYTSAFMEEVFRFRTLGPLGVQHVTSSDAKLEEYVIPKGTVVSANIT